VLAALAIGDFTNSHLKGEKARDIIGSINRNLQGDIGMDQILLVESQQMYADEIWKFRQEILERDAEIEDQFAGCMSLDVSKSSEEWIKICTQERWQGCRRDRFASSHKSSCSWNMGRALWVFSAPF